MINFVIIATLGLIFLFNGIHGIPVMNEVKSTNPSVLETPKTKDWISFQPSWSFPSIPAMNRLFRNVEFDESEIKLLTRRIENLEISQKEIYELMTKIPQSACHSSSCSCNSSPKMVNATPLPKSEEIINEQKLPIPTAISTTTVPSTIDYTPKDRARSSTLLKLTKDKELETIASVRSEQSTTTMSGKPIDKSTTSNSSVDNNKSNLHPSDEIQGKD